MFKKFFLCLVLLVCMFSVGCSTFNNTSDSKDGWTDSLSSIQIVEELVPGEQNPITIMKDKKEVAEFIQKLQMDKWEMDEIPSSKKKMKEYILYQQETIKFGESNKDKKLKQVASLITYHDLPYIELKWSKFNLVFKVPEDVVEYLSMN